MTDYWTCNHFSRANPEGPAQSDVPALLRSVADAIEELGAIEVPDVTMESEVNEHVEWWSATVYFHFAEES